jgi:curved DNA-binding protein CbpA
MEDWYRVLGLPRDASEEQIKAAYRALARKLHPDINIGDAASQQRLQEVNQAYETLGNPEARAAYDRSLAQERADTRRRYAIFAASTVATFALTVTAVSLAIRWHLLAPAPRVAVAHVPPEAAKGPGEIASPRQGQDASWATYRSPSLGFALRYPAGVFMLDSGQSTEDVQTFVSRDGRAVLRILAAKNPAGMTLSAFRRSLMKKRYAGASFDQAPQSDYWFALSGTRGENAFYERVTFSCDRKSMHGWQMVYPSSERATYDKLARLVLRNHPHGNGPGAGCSGEQAYRSSRQPPIARFPTD